MAHEVPDLPYAYDALEPHIDKETMQIHHDKHHQAYVDNLNKAVKGTDLEDKPVEDILRNLSSVPDSTRAAVRNHGGGHANHSLFWTVLKKDVKPSGEVLEAINAKWGSLDKFKEVFTTAAMTQFGSGWAWLIVDDEKELQVINLPNQDSPLRQGWTPILGLDVWEHAYYLKYQNKRPAYVEAFWNVVNWDQVNENFKKA